MPVIQVRSRSVRDKELRAVCVRSRVRHGKDALLIVPEAGVKLILEFIPGSARAASRGVAALRHEVGNYTVEHHTFIKSFARQEDKIIDRLRHLIREKLD